MTELEVLKLIAGHKRMHEEADYCYVCDEHPSHGHAVDCPFVTIDRERSALQQLAEWPRCNDGYTLKIPRA